MKAWQLQHAFGLENLTCVELPQPEPGPDDVLIRVLATSLNYRDLRMITGQYNPKQPLPLIPVSDGVGEVVACGKNVQGIRKGDRVAALMVQGWMSGPPTLDFIRHRTLGGPLPGMLQEYVVLPQNGVIHVPLHLSDEEASTLPCAALTAWSALITLGKLESGQKVLVQGSGGVSVCALQIARAQGAHVLATSRSDEKRKKLESLGAEYTINYTETKNWGKWARTIGDGQGVDHVIEVGGEHTLGESLQAVKPGAHISIIGVLSGTMAHIELLPILMRQICVQGVFVGHREGFTAMNAFLAHHHIKPVVGKTFSFDEVPAAFNEFQTSSHFGKICVRVTD